MAVVSGTDLATGHCLWGPLMSSTSPLCHVWLVSFLSLCLSHHSNKMATTESTVTSEFKAEERDWGTISAMSGILKEEGKSFPRIILSELTSCLIDQKRIMWSLPDSKQCDKVRNLSTTYDLVRWFLNLAAHLYRWLSTSILKYERYVLVLWLGKKWKTVIDKIKNSFSDSIWKKSSFLTLS